MITLRLLRTGPQSARSRRRRWSYGPLLQTARAKIRKEKEKAKVAKEPFQHLGASNSIRKRRLGRAYALTSTVRMAAQLAQTPLDSKPAPKGSTFVERPSVSEGPHMGLATIIIHTSEKLGLLQGLEIHRRTLQQQPPMPVVIRCLIYPLKMRP